MKQPLEEIQSNMFVTTLADLRAGRSANELSIELQKLVQAVRETGKKGTLTYKLHIEPAAKGNINTLMIEDEVTVKMPEMDREAAIFFSTDDNRLTRRDPRQREFSMSVVEGDKPKDTLAAEAKAAS